MTSDKWSEWNGWAYKDRYLTQTRAIKQAYSMPLDYQGTAGTSTMISKYGTTAHLPPLPKNPKKLPPIPKRKPMLHMLARAIGDRLPFTSLVNACDALPAGMAPMGGGEAEVEVERTVDEDDRRKKITLKRLIGPLRDKGSGPKETHRGSIHFVRAAKGDKLTRSTLGIKAEPIDSGHVEVPFDDALEAIFELNPKAFKRAAKKLL